MRLLHGVLCEKYTTYWLQPALPYTAQMKTNPLMLTLMLTERTNEDDGEGVVLKYTSIQRTSVCPLI